MDLKEHTRSATSSEPVTGLRSFGVFVATAMAYGVGFYVAVAILLWMFGLNNASGAPWDIATIALGSLLGGMGGTLASPRTGWAPLIVAVAVGAFALLLGTIVGIGLEYSIGTGVVIALLVTMIVYVSGHPQRS